MFTQSPSRTTEEPVRIRGLHADLAGMLHRPESPSHGPVLLCTADGEERAWSHRTYVFLARRLAAHGHVVLRFEYTGQGESDGVYEESSVESRLDDIQAAMDRLAQESHSSTPAVVAARAGAAFALEFAARAGHRGAIVLLEPVMDLPAYVRNLVRINLTTQMVIHRRVIRDSDALLADVVAGGYISANGYRLGHRLLEGLNRLQPAERLASCLNPVLIVTTPANRVFAPNAEIVRQPFAPFWKEPKGDMAPPALVLEATTSWLDRQATGGL